MSIVFVIIVEDGGRRPPFTSGYRSCFFSGVINVTGVIHAADGALFEPGAQVGFSFELNWPVDIEPGVVTGVAESVNWALGP